MVLFAKDIAEPEFLSMGRDVKALDAAKQMKKSHRGFVVIVSDEGKPVGVVTEWDFLSEIVAEGKVPESVKLSDIMSKDLVTVNANDGIDAVAKLMAEKGIRRVLVVQDDKIIGAVTSKTILRRLEDYVNNVSAQIARLQAPIF